MAKDKNHSGKNQSFKNHRNGIKKPLRQKYASLKAVMIFYSLMPFTIYLMILFFKIKYKMFYFFYSKYI